MGRTNPRVMTALAVLIGAASFVALRWFPLAATGGGRDVHEIVLVAREMAFHPEDEPGAVNPTLRVQAGSRVRIVIRNEERGITHTFTIPAWDVDTGKLDGPGTARVEFVVPATKGHQNYQCTPHAAMMRGMIEVH